MVLDVARLLHKTTEGPLRIGTSCIKKNAELLGYGICINPFSNRTSGVATAHRKRVDEQMRERVQ